MCGALTNSISGLLLTGTFQCISFDLGLGAILSWKIGVCSAPQDLSTLG